MAIPRKVTFEEARQSAADSLDKLVVKAKLREQQTSEAQTSDSDFTHATVDLSGKLADRFRKRLEKLAGQSTTEAQRERYGIQEWYHDFLHIERQFVWLPGPRDGDYDPRGSDVAKSIMTLMRGTRFSRIGCSFCEKHSLPVPRVLLEAVLGREIQAEEWECAGNLLGELQQAFKRGISRQVKTSTKDLLNSFSLAGLPLSPDLLPNGFVQASGLLRFKEGVKPWRAVELKNTSRVINGIKRAFESLVRLEPANSRIWRFAPDSSECDSNPASGLLHPALSGTFFYFRGDDATQPRSGKGATARQAQEEQWFRRETPGYFVSVYSLYRATLNKNASYNQELAALSSLGQTAKDINLRIARDWRRDTPADLRAQMKEELERFIEGRALPFLKGAKHVAKQEATTFLQSMQQALAEPAKNPSMVVARMQPLLLQLVAMRERLVERRKDIPAKSSYNNRDEMTIHWYITEQQRAFQDIRESLKGAQDVITRHSEFFDRRVSESRAEAAWAANHILSELNIRDTRLTVVTARPLLTFARAMGLVMSELERAVHSRDQQGSEEAVTKLLVLSKLEQAHACIERLKGFVTFCDLKFDAFDDAASDLFSMWEEWDVFSSREVAAYKGVYAQAQLEWRAKANEWRELKQGSLSSDERLIAYREIREYLDHPDRDLEAIVARMAGFELSPHGLSEGEDSEPERD